MINLDPTNLLLAIVVAILGMIVLFQQWAIQTLLNKLMSRNYAEYQSVKVETGVDKKPQRIEVDQGPMEDFGTLSDLSNSLV